MYALLFLVVSSLADVWVPCAHFDDPKVGTVITDIERHYRPLSYMHPASTYRDDDYVTYAHELTHAVHSLIRNTYGNSDTHQAVYCLNDVAYVFTTPKCTLKDVRDRVTRRGEVFQLYFVQMMQHWGHQPLYPLDEAQAYLNGTRAGLEKYGPTLRVRYSYQRTVEFNHYLHAVVQTIEEKDPEYKQLNKLREYVRWHDAQVTQLSFHFQLTRNETIQERSRTSLSQTEVVPQ